MFRLGPSPFPKPGLPGVGGGGELATVDIVVSASPVPKSPSSPISETAFAFRFNDKAANLLPRFFLSSLSRARFCMRTSSRIDSARVEWAVLTVLKRSSGSMLGSSSSSGPAPGCRLLKNDIAGGVG